MNTNCHDCQAVLQSGPTMWSCSACARSYPAVLGIPDMRPTPISVHAADDEGLATRFADASFSELLAMHSPNFSTDNPALIASFTAYREQGSTRGKRFFDMVMDRAQPTGRGKALIIGCGSGAMMLWAARAFDEVVGIDPSLPELILAKKAAEEARLTNITLIRGFAQQVPYAQGTFDLIVGENVLEHVHDVDGVLRECARVLSPNGWFVADSANRYNLLLPEPHVKLMWVGFLPRRWQARYCLWRGGFRGYDRGIELPSYLRLARPLRRYFQHGRITFPSMEAYGFPKALNGLCRLIEKIPLFAQAVLAIFPAHLVLATHTIHHPR